MNIEGAAKEMNLPKIPCTRHSELFLDAKLVEAALLAGEGVSELRRTKKASDILTSLKSDGSLVTEADLLSDAMLTQAIKAHYPLHLLISEEGHRQSDIDASIPAFIVDPLDGTRNYKEGKSDFAILLARRESEGLIYGLIHYPEWQLLIEGHSALGTFANGSQCWVSDRLKLEDERLHLVHCRATQDRSFLVDGKESTEALIDVAMGLIDGAIIRLCGHAIWDFAAGVVAIEAAGGKVTDEKGQPLSFACSEFDPTYVVASNGGVHHELMRLLTDRHISA
jgi:fructose-1,6-bisphosphatase/inositol monophosphatase family enzyme